MPLRSSADCAACEHVEAHAPLTLEMLPRASQTDQGAVSRVRVRLRLLSMPMKVSINRTQHSGATSNDFLTSSAHRSFTNRK